MTYKSKSLATWLALLGGAFGAHRFYLRGPRDGLAWAHMAPAALGVMGLERFNDFGIDDRLFWLLTPLGGVMVAQACLFGILYGLTPDERWDARQNPGQPVRATRWAPIIGAALCLLIGATCLMTSIAMSTEHYFEAQADAGE